MLWRSRFPQEIVETQNLCVLSQNLCVPSQEPHGPLCYPEKLSIVAKVLHFPEKF